MNKEDKKLQEDLVNEMMEVSKTNPDVMIYMQSLMECYEDLEEENKKLLEENEELKLVRSTCAFCPYYTENKELKEKYLNAVADYEETKSEWQELHNKIDKAIEILKEHFVEEYIRSCDTSDGVGKYEIDTEHWTYKVYEQLKDSDVDD